MRQLGYDARPAVIGEINKETQYVLNQAGLEAPELLTDTAAFYVEMNKASISYEGMTDEEIFFSDSFQRFLHSSS